MIPNWSISTPSKGLSRLSGSEAERSEENNISAKLSNALLIDSDRVQKLPQLAFWFICLYLGSKSTFPEFWIFFPSHLSSWQLKTELPVFYHHWKTKHRFSAAVSGTNQGAEGNNLLFKWLYFENFWGARTQFNRASPDSSSRKLFSQVPLLVNLPKRDFQKPPG